MEKKIMALGSRRPSIDNKFHADGWIVLHHGDTMDLIATMPSGSIKLIITSPPYNLGKEYETRVRLRSYLETQAIVIKELIRVLNDGGSICWQVGNYVEDGEVYPLDIYYYDIFKDHGLRLRNRIVWHFGHGLHSSKRLSGRYETICGSQNRINIHSTWMQLGFHQNILVRDTIRVRIKENLLEIRKERIHPMCGRSLQMSGERRSGRYQM